MAGTARGRVDRETSRPRGTRSVVRTHARLVGDDGKAHLVNGNALVGRSPTIKASHGVVSMIVLEDDTRSLSKTHATLRFEDVVLWVIDHDSRNGTAITGPVGTIRVGSDAWIQVLPGEYVHFGERWLRVLDELPPAPTSH